MTEVELVQIERQAAESLEALPEHTAHYKLASAASALVAEVRRLQGEVRPLQRALSLIRVNPGIAADVVAALEPEG